jgi:hypothetical protein
MIEPIGSSLLQASARRQLIFAGAATSHAIPLDGVEEKSLS